MSFSAVILAGGKSSRMGRDKAFLEIGRQTLLARQIQIVQEAGATEVFISGRADVDYSVFGLRVLADKFSDAGPLAGIHAALLAAGNSLLLALAVDLPEICPSFLNNLMARATTECGVIPRVAGQIEPLAAFYPRVTAGLAGTMLAKKNFAAQEFARTCIATGQAIFTDFPAEDASYFKNLNSPADLLCLN
jgi:molybdopterin-guanine dinucleotide biosynthesis protein A